jgi:hypothetical protein
MDPRYLNCFICSRYVLSILILSVLVFFLEYFKYFVFLHLLLAQEDNSRFSNFAKEPTDC